MVFSHLDSGDGIGPSARQRWQCMKDREEEKVDLLWPEDEESEEEDDAEAHEDEMQDPDESEQEEGSSEESDPIV